MDFFPRIARGHRSADYPYHICRCNPKGAPATTASFTVDKKTKEESYVDGHFQSQHVAQKAHERGIR